MSNDIKDISIRDFLRSAGVKPAYEKTHYGMYLSPFRQESNASLRVDYQKNVWYDHGAGEGGSIIDLVMKMDGCDFKTAVNKLQKGGSSIATHIPTARNSNGIVITEVLPLKHPALLNYLESRNIDLSIARQYCCEVKYQMNGKPYFAIGFKNDAGGWELRDPLYKRSNTPKSITTFRNESRSCMVFEGFMDFLSYLTLKKNSNPTIDTTVLNSVALLKKAIPFLQAHKTIHTFLDNDHAGRQATAEIMRSCPDSEVVDQSYFYREKKDLNEYLQERSEKKPTHQQPQTAPSRRRGKSIG